MTMATLNTQPNLPDPDDFYEALIAAHRGLSDAQSTMVNAKLVLILANQVGKHNVLNEALRLAKLSLPVASRQTIAGR